MLQTLKRIFINRAKIGGVNFILEIVIGVLSEWQRSNRDGNLDFNAKKNVFDTHGSEPQNSQNFEELKNKFKY